jgi:glycosyltransferase involved in cell wall biosynthesis
MTAEANGLADSRHGAGDLDGDDRASSLRPEETVRRAPLVVAIVSDAIYPYHKGGKEVLYYHLAQGLSRRGFEVHVFTMRWWAGPRDRTDDGVVYHALCRRDPLYSGSRRSVVQAVMFALACLRLVRFDFDVIDADHMPHLQLFTIKLVSLVRRAPLVVTWHEYWGRAYWREYLGRLGDVAALVERSTIRLGDQLVADSPTTAARLVERGIPTDSVTVVPVGIDLDEIARTPASDEKYDVLYVGRLIGHKHVDALIDALEELRSRGTPRTCAIVGEGPERESLEASAVQKGVGEDICFLGNVEEHSTVFSLMKSAGVFVLPSTREGFGIVVAEAIACGLPVLTVDHPDNEARALVEPGVTGWLCDPDGPSIAAGIETALSSDRKEPLVSPQRLSGLGWDSTVDKVADILTQLGTRRGHGRHG